VNPPKARRTLTQVPSDIGFLAESLRANASTRASFWQGSSSFAFDSSCVGGAADPTVWVKPADKKPDPLNPAKPTEMGVLSMELQLGDRLSDERSEWQVIGWPYTTAGGKTVHVRVESVKQPGATDIRTWGAHERVAVRRATTEEGDR
jgi:hypothetical protein